MSKLRDFNLLKVADVSSNSTTTNSVSVVVNADTSGNSQNQSDSLNFTQSQIQTPIYPSITAKSSTTTGNITQEQEHIAAISESQVEYPSSSNLLPIRQLENQLAFVENELKFYKLLSTTLSNLLKDNNPKLIINLIDQSGKIIIEAATLIELIGIKTNMDPKLVNIQYKDEEAGCIAKISPIKNIANIKIDNESLKLKYNKVYNILQDDFNISLSKTIILKSI